MRYEDIHFYPKPERDELHRRNITAAKIMDNEEATKLWDFISKNFQDVARVAMIEPEEPDEFDLEMLEEIKNDPDCHIFAPAEEVEAYLMGLPDGEETA